jgi:hypothetical protein
MCMCIPPSCSRRDRRPATPPPPPPPPTVSQAPQILRPASRVEPQRRAVLGGPAACRPRPGRPAVMKGPGLGNPSRQPVAGLSQVSREPPSQHQRVRAGRPRGDRRRLRDPGARALPWWGHGCGPRTDLGTQIRARDAPLQDKVRTHRVRHRAPPAAAPQCSSSRTAPACPPPRPIALSPSRRTRAPGDSHGKRGERVSSAEHRAVTEQDTLGERKGPPGMQLSR